MRVFPFFILFCLLPLPAHATGPGDFVSDIVIALLLSLIVVIMAPFYLKGGFVARLTASAAGIGGFCTAWMLMITAGVEHTINWRWVFAPGCFIATLAYSIHFHRLVYNLKHAPEKNKNPVTIGITALLLALPAIGYAWGQIPTEYEKHVMQIESNLVSSCYSANEAPDIPENMLKIGECLYYGTGWPRDVQKGLQWMEQAAKLGHSNALQELAHLYAESGQPVFDYPKAVEWYKYGAKTGNYHSQTSLIDLYAMNPEKADWEDSYFWMCVAWSEEQRAQTYYKIQVDNVLPHLKKEQIAEIEAKAAAWKPEPGPVWR